MSKSTDLVVDALELKAQMFEFYLDTKAWRTFKAGTPDLTWTKVSFDPGSKSKLPNSPGLYVFTAQIDHASFPAHAYILYVGETGAGKSAATLRSRFGQYLKEKDADRGRPAIQFMLNKWNADLMFYFAEVADQSRIADLETALIKATFPPYNRLIVDVTLSKARQAVFR